ncbi:MAG: type II secretion system protein [bacterium]
MRLNNKAFTIVELLVVMAVIGVLLSLAVFGIQALQKNQRETQRLNDLRNIQGSLESYYSKYRRYPTENELKDTYVATAPKLLNGSLLNEINAQRQVGGFVPRDPNVFVLYYGNVVYATIPIQSLTPTVMNVGYMYATCSDNGINSDQHVATADTWWVGYSTALVDNPQEYGLYGCTENGLSTNLGSKNDGEGNGRVFIN